MTIEKTARRKDFLKRSLYEFPSARTAFKAYLRSLDFKPGEKVFLPAYIGWSAREGSGVFDPVIESGVDYGFYPLDRNLRIRLDLLEPLLEANNVKLFVVIHYFGYVDPHYERLTDLLRRRNIIMLEDEAHALFTDFVAGISGRRGDAAIFSLHKMLPLDAGGILLMNGREDDRFPQTPTIGKFFDYDYFEIARRRRENAERISQLLAPYRSEIEPLRPEAAFGEVPQTFPVVLHSAPRDKLYEKMNEAGFGVVSLYHTMISQISPDEFPDAHRLSQRILNLPVHQDVEPEQIDAMIETLLATIRGLQNF